MTGAPGLPTDLHSSGPKRSLRGGIQGGGTRLRLQALGEQVRTVVLFDSIPAQFGFPTSARQTRFVAQNLLTAGPKPVLPYLDELARRTFRKFVPTPAERDTCAPWLDAELALVLPSLRAVVALGAFAWDAACRLLSIRPKPRFGHGAEHATEGGPVLLGTYHPSQQNTFTGKLTEPMLDAVFERARELAGL